MITRTSWHYSIKSYSGSTKSSGTKINKISDTDNANKNWPISSTNSV